MYWKTLTLSEMQKYSSYEKVHNGICEQRKTQIALGKQCLYKGYHGGELHDILHLYSDRTDENIRHYFLKFILNEFSYGKNGFFFVVANRYLRDMHAVFFLTTSSKVFLSLFEAVRK